jgi:predicted RNA-binding Zn ribbon-like protein
MPDHPFQLVGGDAVLDFLNTIHDWTAADPRDYIPTFAESLRFAQVAGVITAAEAKRLGTRPAGAELRRLHEVRARLERVCRAVLDGRAPRSADLDALARDAAAAARTARLRTQGGQLTRTIDPTVAGLATVRLRLVEAAVTLLTSERVARLGACPSCGWLFLDTTKNRSRRWCSMAMCGDAAKSRTYYWRTRGRSA